MTINIGDTSRTIEPDNLECSEYQIFGKRDGESEFSSLTNKINKDKPITINDLLIGKWTFYAEGYNTNKDVVGRSANLQKEIKAGG